MKTRVKLLVGLGALLTSGITSGIVLGTQGTASGDVGITCPVSPATATATCIVNTATGVDGAEVDTTAGGIDAGLQGTDWTLADMDGATPSNLTLAPGGDSSGVLPDLTAGQLDSAPEVGAPAILPLNPAFAVPAATDYVRGASR